MWFSISVYSPAKEYFVAVFDVITERKQMEEKLRSAAHRWQTTFDAISDAVCLLDRDSLILLCNQAMADLPARPVAEIIGRPYWEVLPQTSEPTPGYPLGSKLESNRRATHTLPFDDGWLHVMADPS